jgi:hypothetical protein
MKTLSFELTMPKVGSWNGKWTSAEKKHFIIKSVHNDVADKIMDGAKSYPLYEGILVRTLVGETPLRKEYYYDFGDGWTAGVRVELIDAKEGNKRRKQSCGFAGYDWMVASIFQFDDILNDRQRKERLAQIQPQN